MNKHRLVILDGFRVLAAVMVCLHHGATFFGMPESAGYLAVDLFFVLSGFVIVHAYQSKLQSGDLDFWGFVKTRLIRLMPMVLIANTIAFGLRFRRITTK